MEPRLNYIRCPKCEGNARECNCESDAAEAFKQKLREMRESGSIPGYIGPRAAK